MDKKIYLTAPIAISFAGEEPASWKRLLSLFSLLLVLGVEGALSDS